MGRIIPTNEADLLIHPLSLSLFAAGMAVASIAMITALCSFRRKAPRNVDDDDDLQSPAASNTKEESGQPDVADVRTTEEPAAATTTATQEPETVDNKEKENEDGEDIMNKELPLPPGKTALGLEPHTTNAWDACNAKTTTSQMKKSSSERRLLSHLSIKLPRSFSMAKKGEKSKDEFDNQKHKHRGRKLSMAAITKQEESVWMKTIILGEKCKVPDEEEVAIYDAKGRKIPAYHPKSRQSSFIDQNALPNNRIDTSAIPDQRRSNASHVEIDRNKKDEHQHKEPISADEEELMSLSQI